MILSNNGEQVAELQSCPPHSLPQLEADNSAQVKLLSDEIERLHAAVKAAQHQVPTIPYRLAL